MIKKMCPVCETDEFVNYQYGSHAMGKDNEHADELFFCDKCGGCFSVRFKKKNDKMIYLKIDYSSDRPTHDGCHTLT